MGWRPFTEWGSFHDSRYRTAGGRHPLPYEHPALPLGETRCVCGQGVGELHTQVGYFIWEEWYLWVGAPGYLARVVSVPTEPKIGLIVGALFLLWPVVWAMGPDDDAHMEAQLTPK